MSKRPAASPPTQPPNQNPDEPGFEESLAELERIVEAMEQDQLPLESLIESYEKGSRLLARCEAVLAAARQRLEVIQLGPTETADPLAPPAGPATDDPGDVTAGDAPAANNDDEIRLF